MLRHIARHRLLQGKSSFNSAFSNFTLPLGESSYSEERASQIANMIDLHRVFPSPAATASDSPKGRMKQMTAEQQLKSCTKLQAGG
jgi:hypothetical protein